jgi:hypothetical protein
MKIDNQHQIFKSLYPDSKNDPRQVAGEKFGDILKETIGNQIPQTAGVRPAGFANSLSAIRPASTADFDRQTAIDHVENLLGLLDDYRRNLSDPGINLRQINPIVQEMDKLKETLAPVLDSLPDDEKLKDIVNQTLVTASLEITKFYRGDYIAS